MILLKCIPKYKWVDRIKMYYIHRIPILFSTKAGSILGYTIQNKF